MNSKTIVLLIGLALQQMLTNAYHCDRNFHNAHRGLQTKFHCIQATLADVIEETNEPWNITKLTLQRPPGMKTLDKAQLVKLPQLIDLEIAFSKIHQLDTGAFSEFPNLIKVALKSNPIQKLATDVLKNSSIRFFFLQGSKSLRIPENQPVLQSEILQVLHIKACNLRRIHAETFKELPNLNSLNLKKNLLESIPTGAFSNNPHLRLLLLQGNKMKTLSVDVFRDHYERKVAVHLNKNPWKCDCQLLPLMQWTQISIKQKETRCRQPKGVTWEAAGNLLDCNSTKIKITA